MGKNMRTSLIIISAALTVFLVCQASFAGDQRPVAVKKTDKCQVCGMFVSGYKEWIAQIIFKDGSYAVFDGPKDMFRYYFNISKYNNSKTQADVAAIYATEYYSAKLTDAKTLLFVQGSDVNGPMGPELVPVGSPETAKEFMKDHKGRKIMKFTEIAPGELK